MLNKHKSFLYVQATLRLINVITRKKKKTKLMFINVWCKRRRANQQKKIVMCFKCHGKEEVKLLERGDCGNMV